MTSFKGRVEALNKQIDDVRAEFEKFVADKTHPLDERWEVFMSVPNNLRGSNSWVPNFEGVPSDDIGYDGPVYAERYQEVTVEQIVTVWEDREEYDNDFSEWNITAFKEDVLRQNIYSFTYDW